MRVGILRRQARRVEISKPRVEHNRRHGRRPKTRLCVLLVGLLSWGAVETAEHPAASLPDPARLEVFTVGGDYNYPPFEYLNAQGLPVGFNVDLLRAIAEVMGFQVQFRLTPWYQAREALERGEVQILPMPMAPEYFPFADFTEAYTLVYFETYSRLNAPAIHGVADLAGQNVIVQRNSLTQNHLSHAAPEVRLVPVESEPDALRLLASGKYDYALVSRVGGLVAADRYRLSNLVTTGPPLLPHGLSLAVAKGNFKLREQLEQGLAILKATGRYQDLYERWFGELLASPLTTAQIVRYGVWILTPLCLLGAVVLTWFWQMRSQVAQRTRELQRELADRRLAEAALKDSETRFRDFTEAASDWIWEMDERYRFTCLSDRFYQLTGIPPKHIIGRTRWELAATDADPELWAHHRATLESHQPFRDFVYKTKPTDREGQPRHFKISGKPIRDIRGRFKGYRGTGTDITEQREAELALRESQRTLETLMDNLPGMAYRCRNDPDRTLEFVSPGAIGLTGYLPAQLIHNREQSFGELIHEADRKRVWEEIQVALGERRPYRVTYRIHTQNGQERWIWEQGRGVFSLQDELQALEGLLLDITEQVRTEEERTRLRLYLKNVIDSMPSILVGVDAEGRITEWNQPAERKSGLSREKAQGRFFGEVFPDLKSQLEKVHQAIQQGHPIKTPRLPTNDVGGAHFSDVMVYPLVANGAVGAVIRVDDVTARVRIEEMMVQTEKMLSVGGLAAGMAHEINNPLGTIIQGSQNILRRLTPDLPKNRETAENLGLDMDRVRAYLEARGILHFLEGIREAGMRAAKIVTDMLAFSRSSESRFVPTDLGEILDMVVRLAASDYDLKKHYDFKQIHIIREYDPQLGLVPCDKTQIEQVVLNLVKNAAQAMAVTDHPRITLCTRRESHHARVEIIDNGPGMEEAIRKRVFEPFFTTKEVGVGTGLGLSVSYFIITEQHKGTLTVTSSPGKGAQFTLRLPLSHETQA